MTSRHCNQVRCLAGQKRVGGDEQCADLVLGKGGGERIDIMCVACGQNFEFDPDGASRRLEV